VNDNFVDERVARLPRGSFCHQRVDRENKCAKR
jgi:hypothetical protein